MTNFIEEFYYGKLDPQARSISCKGGVGKTTTAVNISSISIPKVNELSPWIWITNTTYQNISESSLDILKTSRQFMICSMPQ